MGMSLLLHRFVLCFVFALFLLCFVLFQIVCYCFILLFFLDVCLFSQERHQGSEWIRMGGKMDRNSEELGEEKHTQNILCEKNLFSIKLETYENK